MGSCQSVAAYALFRWVIVKQSSVALVVALAVLSHWFFDLIVHTPAVGKYGMSVFVILLLLAKTLPFRARPAPFRVLLFVAFGLLAPAGHPG